MPTTREEPAPGSLLDGRYRLGELLGRGGMSVVHRAEDLQLGRTVAIKLLAADLDDDGATRARAEVVTLASLNHPSLVTLFDARLDHDRDYLVMEFVDGPTLREALRQGPLSPAELAPLAVELAEALHAAHRAGVVHRDVKPSNVLLAPAERPGRRWRAKLADFGIAYLLGSDRVTTPGSVIGSAAYLAPEQALGEAPAPTSDIYALGLVLLEALTGAPAFPDATPQEAMVRRLAVSPTIPGSVPPGWAGLLGRMTAMDPSERPTAAEVASAAEGLAHAAPVRDDPATGPTAVLGPVAAADPTLVLTAPRPVPSAARRRTLLTAAAAVAAVLAIALGAWAAGDTASPGRTVSPGLTSKTTVTTPAPPPADAPPPATDDGKGPGKAGDDERKAREQAEKDRRKADKDDDKGGR